MPTIKTTMCALGLGLLLSGMTACDKTEPDKQDADKTKASKSDAGDKTGPGPAAKKEGASERRAKPPPSKHTVINEYVICVESCADKSADDRPTCHKNCAATVTAGTGDPAATACPRGCTEEYGSCLLPCADKEPNNAATCRLQCQQLADKCVEGCL
jgi:hypothetical protein